MQYSLTIFKSIYDNKTHKKMVFNDWSGVEKLLFDLYKQPGYKPKKDEKFKDGSPLISPAVYKENEKRRNVNVLGWGGWCALDIDDYNCSFQEVTKSFENIKHILYNSSSSTEEKPKFRVVIPFERFIEAKEIKHPWYSLNCEFNSLADPQTKDLSRMYYVPAQYPNAYSFFQYNEDSPMLDVDELMKKHEFFTSIDTSFKSKLSGDMQQKLMKYKLNQLNNTDITWSSYHNCPFVKREMVTEYMNISETGWYHKLYQIMISIASGALYMNYPITIDEIVSLCKEIDNNTGGWYKNRPMHVEAQRALDYVLQNI